MPKGVLTSDEVFSLPDNEFASRIRRMAGKTVGVPDIVRDADTELFANLARVAYATHRILRMEAQLSPLTLVRKVYRSLPPETKAVLSLRYNSREKLAVVYAIVRSIKMTRDIMYYELVC